MQSAICLPAVSNTRLWTGRSLTGLVTLFMVFDGAMKVIKEHHVIEASSQLGLPASSIVGIGAILLICTALYVIPRTSIFGAILLTGYLGGATAINLQAGRTLFETVFPVIFGVLVWAGIFLRHKRLQTMIPIDRDHAS
ncbi:MAG TPA: DoxX family protein [Blastocatellia bacterium]